MAATAAAAGGVAGHAPARAVRRRRRPRPAIPPPVEEEDFKPSFQPQSLQLKFQQYLQSKEAKTVLGPGYEAKADSKAGWGLALIIETILTDLLNTAVWQMDAGETVIKPQHLYFAIHSDPTLRFLFENGAVHDAPRLEKVAFLHLLHAEESNRKLKDALVHLRSIPKEDPSRATAISETLVQLRREPETDKDNELELPEAILDSRLQALRQELC